MIPKPHQPFALGALFIVVAALLLLAGAAHETSGADTVRKVRLDFQPNNEITNQPNGSLGRVQQCPPSVNGFGTFEFDLLVYDVPVGGIRGFAVELTYDGTTTQVSNVDVAGQMLGVAAGSGPIDVTHNPLPDNSGDFTLTATDLGTGYETGDGVLAHFDLQALTAGPTIDTWSANTIQILGGDGTPLLIDDVDLTGSVAFGEPPVGGCDLAWPEVCNNGIDDDGDSQADEPAPWPVPPNDQDCDGFSDGDEATIGTLADFRCWPFPVGDQWPPDFDGNDAVNITDVLSLKPVFNSSVPPTSARFDLLPDGSITISDVLRMKPFFGQDCLN